MPGFVAKEIQGKFSLRASYTAELSFADVRVPAKNMLPGVQGLKGPLSCLNKARLGIAFAVMGAAVACFEGAREYALSPRAVRQAHRRLPAHAGEARRHAAGDRQGAAARLRLARLADEKGKADAGAGLACASATT